MEIKERDIVTISIGEYQTMSNTYIVLRKLQGESVLVHPIAMDCCILKKDNELNANLAQGQNPVERCLIYAKAHTDILGHSMAADLDALCYYFIVKKNFTQKQRHDLTNIVGKIASVVLASNQAAAANKVKKNAPLLDEYSNTLYQKNKHIIETPSNIQDRTEKFTLFNLAGFILAQEYQKD